MKTSLLTCR